MTTMSALAHDNVVELAPSLAALAERARREHDLVEAALGDAVQHALAAGDALLAAQAQIPFGQWQAWLADNCGLFYKNASKYMRLAKNREKVIQGGATSITHALEILRGEGRLDPVMKQRARDMRAQGMSYSEIGRELGVNSGSVWVWLNPKLEEQRKKREKRLRVDLRRERDRQEARLLSKELGDAYGKVTEYRRKMMDELQRIIDKHEGDPEARREFNKMMQHLNGAEYAWVRGLRLSKPRT